MSEVCRYDLSSMEDAALSSMPMRSESDPFPKAVLALVLCLVTVGGCGSRDVTDAADATVDATAQDLRSPRCVAGPEHGLSIGVEVYGWYGLPSPVQLTVAKADGCTLMFDHENAPKIGCSGADLTGLVGQKLIVHHCADDVGFSRFFSVWTTSGEIVLAGGTGNGIPPPSCLHGVTVAPVQIPCGFHTSECGERKLVGLKVSWSGASVDLWPGEASELEVAGRRMKAFSRELLKKPEATTCLHQADYQVSFGLLR